MSTFMGVVLMLGGIALAVTAMVLNHPDMAVLELTIEWVGVAGVLKVHP